MIVVQLVVLVVVLYAVGEDEIVCGVLLQGVFDFDDKGLVFDFVFGRIFERRGDEHVGVGIVEREELVHSDAYLRTCEVDALADGLLLGDFRRRGVFRTTHGRDNLGARA